MGSHVNTLWLFALATRSDHFTATITSLILTVASLTLIWLVVALVYWAHPGGPAWGKHFWTRGRVGKPVPGPRGWPILGSLGLRTGLAHRKLAAVAAQLNARRLMAFSVGPDTRAIVTCDPDVAREILNSPAFADRPAQESAYGLMFHRAIGFAPHGAYWQALRRAGSAHLFGPKQMKAQEAQRTDIAAQMVKLIGSRNPQNGAFRVRDVLKTASLSNMMWSVFGRKYGLQNAVSNGEVEELKEMVEEGYDLLGILNLGDHFSLLADFDFQKVRSRCSRLVPKVNRFVGRIIQEHRSNPAQVNRDFVDVLLSLQQPKLSESDIIAVSWEMIFRGTDAIAVLIEWVLARLVLHPDVQSTVHDELDRVVGRSRAVEESDLTSLVYLTALIKEVLRMHPPGPLLAWSRLSIEDTTVDGCHVPAGTTASVNMWAIGRDPDVWENPLRFDPGRFLIKDAAEAEFSVMGSDLRLAPFGSGRRSCPGKVMGFTTVCFWVASLLHEFKWEASRNNEVDLSEELRLSCEMANPLKVEVKPRRI